jgi:hypothetical protein
VDPATFPANYPVLPDSCSDVEFSILVTRQQMVIYGANANLEHLGHHGLAQPDRVVLEPALHAGPAVAGLIQQNLPSTGGNYRTFILR